MARLCSPSEYDCWFQNRRNLLEEPLSPAMEESLGTLRVLPGTGPVPGGPGTGGDIFKRAAEELCRGLEHCFGLSPRLAAPEAPGGGGLSLGLIGDFNKGLSPPLPPQGAGGFVIRRSGGSFIIAGQDEAGCLYGVFRFLSLAALGELEEDGERAESPAMPLRVINHWDNLDGSVERGYAGPSLFFKNNRFDYEEERMTDYARLLASLGINRISINNVNVRGPAARLITGEYLPAVARLAAIFRPFGIRLLLSINFAAPYLFHDLDTADPLDPRTAEWWKNQTDLVYRYVPDLAGFLVKADSEGEPGPFQYGRTHAEGANMLARALAPHGGILIWRCFVYNCFQDWRDLSIDRAKAAYDNFFPLDGCFDHNVLLQIKFGPIDFQLREPVSPLFGALVKTRHLMELQITQEYTGQQIDLCFLPWIWESILDFDTAHGDRGRIRELLGVSGPGGIEGLAGITNTGLDRNWTGHTLAQANLYGYGRLCWNPSLGAREIAGEWSRLSFGSGKAAAAVTEMLLKSYGACEKYSAPFGIGGMITPAIHYGPNVEGYEYSRWGAYHRAGRDAIGIDRSPAGTGYSAQYAEKNAAVFADPARCPENMILFFHRLPYNYRMKNGETLLQNIYNTRFEGYDEVEEILRIWKGLENVLAKEVYDSVLERLKKHLANAREWRDVVNTYFLRRTGIGDARGRRIYE